MSEIILCDIADALEVIADARDEWVISAMIALKISEDVIEMGFGYSTDYDDFRYHMNEEGIEINIGSSGEVDIYKKVWVDGETENSSGWLPTQKEHLVGQWETPERVRKISKDRKEVYYELHLKEWHLKVIDA